MLDLIMKKYSFNVV